MANQAYPMALVTQDSLDSYIRSVNSYPMLTADEERELAERLHYDGEIEAAKADLIAPSLCCSCCSWLLRLWSTYG
ncbi:RNA polymerase sigma factor RpoH [Vibrio variabilis]|uniref:RNA polymerase sigma factor RpoH n=1 Tax=Vibrio variabilis TaxID=990271 RepID=A0ABQ0JKH5_9VIBR|nr:RNA polymerase sigma factor RpoH [Vibrio variabilis]